MPGTPLCSPNPKFAFKKFSLKAIREFGSFEHKPLFSLLGPCSKPFFAPNSDILVWPYCASSTYVYIWQFWQASQELVPKAEQPWLGATPSRVPSSCQSLFCSRELRGTLSDRCQPPCTRPFGAEKCPDLWFIFAFVLI